MIHLQQSVYLVLNSLLDWEPVEKLKQRCDVVSFTFNQYEASSTVLYATKALDRGSRQARKERIAVVKARQMTGSYTKHKGHSQEAAETVQRNWIGIPVVSRQKRYLRAQSQGHHTIDSLEERGVERGRAR